MYILTEFTNEGLKQKNIAEFLAVQQQDIISFAGAGGKTSAIFALADDLKNKYKVLIATTTKMFREQNALLIEENDSMGIKLLAEKFRIDNIVIAGTDLGDKMGSFSLDFLAKIISCSDVSLIEADGAKRLPFKFPRENEPVYLPITNKIIYVVGMKSLGKKLGELARTELLAQFLQKSSEDTLTADDIVKVLNSKMGAQKDIGSRKFFVILNQVDDETVKRQALAVANSFRKCNIAVSIALCKFIDK